MILKGCGTHFFLSVDMLRYCGYRTRKDKESEGWSKDVR